MDRSKKISWLVIILLMPIVALGTLGDQELSVDGAKLIWNNNSQKLSIAASPLMSASVDYILPVADATSGGQALLSNASGVLSWGIPTTSAAHNVLSSTHDATTNAVTRGSLIYGNSTPKWDELVIGANQTVFVSDGTDPSWGTVDISGGTNLAVNTDHLKLTGDTLDFADNQDTNFHYWQGSFLEQIDFTISESSGTVTGSLEKEGTGDLIMFFSDEYTALDCTPAVTVNLTSLVGTDTAPATAFVYIPQSTKTLTAASSWPSAATEHIRVASIVLQGATTTGTDGALMNRNWNDMAFGITDPRGHSLHAAERLRFEHALWNTGIVLTITGSGTGTITLDTSSGTVYQMHLHIFPAIDMAGTGDIHLINLSGSEYSTTSNLVAGITTLADGSTPLGNNKYFNIVVWGVQNRTGETSHLLCNLPTGQYTKSADAIVDSSKFSVHTIPSAFRGTGFLVAELTFQLTGGGTTWTTVQNKDLLGQTPTLTPGGGTTTNITTFSDAQFEVFDNANDAKRGDFELSGITTGNTRTLIWPDVSTKMWADNGSVPLTANWDVGAFDITAAGLTITGCSVLGLNSAVFQPTTDSTTFGQFNDKDGNVIVNVDAVNNWVGIGTTPSMLFEVKTPRTDAHDIFNVVANDGGRIFTASQNSQDDGQFRVYSKTGAVNHQLHAAGSSYFRGGNVGIGETNPETLLELTHATPYIILHNSTHEDTDGGRESRLNFKGEQSGGEETTLARIEAGHDGSADDEKGYLDIFINDGDDGDSPTKALRIDGTGSITTGTWQATDVGISYGGTGQSTAQTAIDALSAVSGATNEHVLTKDTASGNAIWKVTTAVGGDVKVAIDAAAAADYIGAANSDGVLRTGVGLSYTDGGNFVTLAYDVGYIKITDTKAQNTHGGTFTSGAWQTRVLNTEDTDTGNDASLASSQITLSAGTYECSISCPAYDIDRHQTKLYNTTGAVDVLIGTSEFAAAAVDAQTRSFISGRFTIAGSQALEVQHQCQTTRATTGFGLANNFTSEIYTIAEFWRVN